MVKDLVRFLFEITGISRSSTTQIICFCKLHRNLKKSSSNSRLANCRADDQSKNEDALFELFKDKNTGFLHMGNFLSVWLREVSNF